MLLLVIMSYLFDTCNFHLSILSYLAWSSSAVSEFSEIRAIKVSFNLNNLDKLTGFLVLCHRRVYVYAVFTDGGICLDIWWESSLRPLWTFEWAARFNWFSGLLALSRGVLLKYGHWAFPKHFFSWVCVFIEAICLGPGAFSHLPGFLLKTQHCLWNADPYLTRRCDNRARPSLPLVYGLFCDTPVFNFVYFSCRPFCFLA